MTFRVTISPRAIRDLDEIMEWTTHCFGSAASRRYTRLIRQALNDVAQSPWSDSDCITLDGRSYLLYHIRRSRDHVPEHEGRVKSPRHLLVARKVDSAWIEVVCVAHDRNDIVGRIRTSTE